MVRGAPQYSIQEVMMHDGWTPRCSIQEVMMHDTWDSGAVAVFSYPLCYFYFYCVDKDHDQNQVGEQRVPESRN